MCNVTRRPIFEHIKPLPEKAMTTYDQILFTGADIKTTLSIFAANRYIGRLRDTMDIGFWRKHDFRCTLVVLKSLN